MNWFSVLTMVCRNRRYWTCFPCDSMQWTKCCTTFSLTSLQSVALSWKMAHIVCASSSPGVRKRSMCLCSRDWKRDVVYIQVITLGVVYC
jgi:hypothetical protein